MTSAEPKKILVVAESINVEDSSGSKANVALILNLRDLGFEVVVYHYTRKRIELEGIRCIQIKERKTNLLYFLSRGQRKIQHGLKVNLARFLEPRFGFSFTFLNDSKSIEKALKKLNFNPELILTLSKGASFRPHHALLGLPAHHPKWIAYIHDPYPFHYYPDPYNWSEPGYRQKIRFFEEVADKCRWAAFPSLGLKQWMEKHYPGFSQKSLVIPHQLREESDTTEIDLPEFFDEKKFNLLHAGNLMKQRPPFDLIRGFQKFLKENPEAKPLSKLILIGSAQYHEEHLEKLKGEIEQFYFIKENAAFAQVLQMQKKAAVNIILESKAEESPFLPGKFPHCIAAGKPILLLGPPRSESRRLLGQDYEYWSPADDVDKISQLIKEMFELWKRDPESFILEREDLLFYLSSAHLRDELNKIQV
ncbi:glycosyltransferase family protein [Salinimicrobium sediminilitoris]|uniref:glycosyltransferase n=1 Tax=Salinimicrobium sediminilitoris TaxID=2876715 RepID=UPI001E4771A7|nr:glycosyltransferase [Salinimicrobium sediminilitoris]MCC8358529.1 glycosyltransferase [Salinimicrobium sediminilitoris]